MEKPLLSFNNFDKNSLRPRDWKKNLKITRNQQKKVYLISEQFISLGCFHLDAQQSFILGGGFAESGSANCVCNQQVIEYAEYFSNILEGYKVWLHAFFQLWRKKSDIFTG